MAAKRAAGKCLQVLALEAETTATVHSQTFQDRDAEVNKLREHEANLQKILKAMSMNVMRPKRTCCRYKADSKNSTRLCLACKTRRGRVLLG